MSNPPKVYQKPVYSHKTRIRCTECDSLNVKWYTSKYEGLVRYWRCEDCNKTNKTIGEKL
ncbi:MAG: hypothetical protein COA79_20950 [Planctomycetota bacterium]|nr:MAG: hypothetical protein COA79_20950 [Planctomycetota bacterium]